MYKTIIHFLYGKPNKKLCMNVLVLNKSMQVKLSAPIYLNYKLDKLVLDSS